MARCAGLPRTELPIARICLACVSHTPRWHSPWLSGRRSLAVAHRASPSAGPRRARRRAARSGLLAPLGQQGRSGSGRIALPTGQRSRKDGRRSLLSRDFTKGCTAQMRTFAEQYDSLFGPTWCWSGSVLIRCRPIAASLPAWDFLSGSSAIRSNGSPSSIPAKTRTVITGARCMSWVPTAR